jgi:MinD superfamily P-loop ATPase
MKTIVIESQKGGSGKTMLAAHLAVEAERTGEVAWIIDIGSPAPALVEPNMFLDAFYISSQVA